MSPVCPRPVRAGPALSGPGVCAALLARLPSVTRGTEKLCTRPVREGAALSSPGVLATVLDLLKHHTVHKDVADLKILQVLTVVRSAKIIYHL